MQEINVMLSLPVSQPTMLAATPSPAVSSSVSAAKTKTPSASGSTATAAKPASAESPENASSEAQSATDTPFAAVLQRQITQASEQAAASLTPEVADLVAENTDTTQQLPTADALAAMLPMLVSMGQVKQEVSTVDQVTKPDDGDIGAAVAIAQPQSLFTVANDQSQVKNSAGGEIKAQAANEAALFAATKQLTTENTALLLQANGKPKPLEQSFENLVNAVQTHNSATAVAAPTPVHVQAPVGSRSWEGEVGNKLVWMVGNQEQRAELVLNPPELGRIEVSVAIKGDQASAQFVSANPIVRDALESALPRLREILADAGISLGQAQVGSESANQSANDRENRDNSLRRATGNGVDETISLRPVSIASMWQRQNGLVDLFA